MKIEIGPLYFLGEEDEDDYEDDDYEEDDFDDEEEEMFKKTANEFASKLKELQRKSSIKAP